MDEIIEKLKALYYDAKKGKYNTGKCFECNNYKWVLGAGIAYKAMPHFLNTIEKKYILGIEVEIDCIDPDKIELWEKVGQLDEC